VEKTNPIQTQFKPNSQKAKMNANVFIIKDYSKNDDFIVRINKPNFQNAKNERKLNFNKGLQKKRLFSSPKNKPKTNPIFSKAKIACQKIRPHQLREDICKIFESWYYSAIRTSFRPRYVSVSVNLT